ncbi:TolB amino-terminal domain-containing protein [Rhodospirillales bacterium URHD0017]|nr:TolB amino-terminal domain-containing protein [Rhodospirillales bacterium URHD0017]
MRVQFDDYSLDTDRHELRSGPALIPMQPQVFDLLAYLIANRDRVVSKDDLISSIWNGRIVSESTLLSRINAARRAIGDDGGQQRLIRTVPRRGVRFVGIVRELPMPGERRPGPASVESANPSYASPDRPSIAVLPFNNLSGDSGQRYFADGITADIITVLSRVRQFFVIAGSSTAQYGPSSPDVPQVASALGVRYLVQGSVRKAGGRVRISAQLIDGATGKHLWAERFDRKLGDIFAVQDEITACIVGQIEPELGRAEYERARVVPPENLGAWELFHRAMILIARRTREGNAEARQLLARSLDLDPGFASAHAAIAWSEAEDLFFRFADPDPRTILDHARRAVTLDDKDPLAYLALAWALTFAHEPESAIEQATRAIEINPSFAHAHAILGRLLVQSGRCRDGLEHVELALRLSPSDPNARQYLNILAVGHLYLGNDATAVELGRRVLETFDTWAGRMVITSALGHLGDRTTADQSRVEVEKRWPGFSIAQVRNNYLVFHEACRERLIDGLRKAGVPEKSNAKADMRT